MYTLKSKVPQIIKLYQSGQSTYKIADELNSHPQIIRTWLIKNNIPRRSLSHAAQEWKLNEHYFDKIDTEDKAYFLGLLYADGCITLNTVSISLIETDRQILEAFSKALNSNKPLQYVIKEGNRKPQYTLSITNQQIIKSLNKLGITPRKSFTCKFPKNLPKSLVRHFIRGIFDGDGNIYKKLRYKSNRPNPHMSYSFSIVGTKNVIQTIQNIVSKQCKIKKNKLYNPKHMKGKNCYIMTYYTKDELLKIRNYLYKDSNFYLKRKHKIFFNL